MTTLRKLPTIVPSSAIATMSGCRLRCGRGRVGAAARREPAGQFRCPDRLAQEVALGQGAAVLRESVPHPLVFDPLRHDLEAEVLAEVHCGANDGRVVDVVLHLEDERLVD